MTETDPHDLPEVVERIRKQAAIEELWITQHAHQRMMEERIFLDEILDALTDCRVLENYPDHRRGPCCLVHGVTETGRDLHIVCTSTSPVLIMITAYEPKPPQWRTPDQRSQES